MIDAVGILQVHNELTVDPAHLPRVMRSLRRVCKHVIAYDDGSTDGSTDWLRVEADELIEGKTNEWHAELSHKALMLDSAAKHKPKWIVWLDADEEFTPDAVKSIHEYADAWHEKGITGVRFLEVNLWRSRLQHRLDQDHDKGWFMRLWRWHKDLRYASTDKGLHRTQFPGGVDARDVRLPPKLGRVMHYSWDAPRKIAGKLDRYARAGDTKNLPRMRDGDHVNLENVPDEWRWVAAREEGDPKPWSQPFLGPAHEHLIKVALCSRREVAMFEVGGGSSTFAWARALRAGDRLVVWEPAGSPWSAVVEQALCAAVSRGIKVARLTSMLDLAAALRGDHGRFNVVLVDHDIEGVPLDGCRDAAVRALSDGRRESLTPNATIFLHDAQRHHERGAFVTLEQRPDPDWVASPEAELWIGVPPQ